MPKNLDRERFRLLVNLRTAIGDDINPRTDAAINALDDFIKTLIYDEEID
jgi:hypothetical protein